MAIAARVRAGPTLRFEASGTCAPQGKAVTNPAPQADTAVRLTITAVVPGGTLPCATSGKAAKMPRGHGCVGGVTGVGARVEKPLVGGPEPPGAVWVTGTGVGAADGSPAVPRSTGAAPRVELGLEEVGQRGGAGELMWMPSAANQDDLPRV